MLKHVTWMCCSDLWWWVAGLYLTDALKRTCNASCGSNTSSGLPRPFILPSHSGSSICILPFTLVDSYPWPVLGKMTWICRCCCTYQFSCSFQLLIYLRASLDITALSRMAEWKKQSSLILRGSKSVIYTVNPATCTLWNATVGFILILFTLYAHIICTHIKAKRWTDPWPTRSLSREESDNRPLSLRSLNLFPQTTEVFMRGVHELCIVKSYMFLQCFSFLLIK